MRSNKEAESLKIVSKLISQLNTGAIISETKDRYAHYDLYVETPKSTSKIFVEVKERYCDAQKFLYYASQGFLLEQIKYDFLIGKPSRYINLFRFDGHTIIISWNINTLVTNTINKHCRATTDFDNNNQVSKRVNLITPEQGNVYILKDDKFEAIEWLDLKNKLT